MFILNEVMKEKQVTNIRLAEMTGIPKQTIDGYRMGRREPSFSNGLKIADALGVEPHELIAEDEPPN